MEKGLGRGVLGVQQLFFFREKGCRALRMQGARLLEGVRFQGFGGRGRLLALEVETLVFPGRLFFD